MSAEPDTLTAFFQLDDPARAKASARALQRAPELKGARNVSAALRGPAAEAIVWTAKTLLDHPVSNIIGEAWGKWRDLQRFANAPPDQTHELALHGHDIALKRKPSVELVLAGVPTGVLLQFELKVALSVEGALLKIQGGRIIGADVGNVRGAGSFSCGKVTIAERKTAPFKLPGRFTFSPGIAIAH
jgi:hypothetical protein